MKKEQATNFKREFSMRTKLFAMALLAIGASGCVEADPSLVLEGHLFLEGELDEETGAVTGCTDFPSSADSATIRAGRLMVNLADSKQSGFLFNAGLTNRLASSDEYSPIGYDAELRIDQNFIQVDRLEFTFPSEDNAGGFDAFDNESAFTAMVRSNEGFFFAIVDMIPASQIAAWEGQVRAAASAAGGNDQSVVPGVVEIQAFGTTVGGEGIESNVIRMPFDVCVACNVPSTPTCIASE